MADDGSAAVPCVSHSALIAFIAAAYRAVGISPAEAEKAAGLIAQSDLSGADGIHLPALFMPGLRADRERLMTS